MKPTDDELEAMAVRLETRIIQSTMIAEAAAMLRACKDQDTWNAAIEAAAKTAEQQKSWDAHPNSISSHMAKDTAAAIRALKKGPNHDDN